MVPRRQCYPVGSHICLSMAALSVCGDGAAELDTNTWPQHHSTPKEVETAAACECEWLQVPLGIDTANSHWKRRQLSFFFITSSQSCSHIWIIRTASPHLNQHRNWLERILCIKGKKYIYGSILYCGKHGHSVANLPVHWQHLYFNVICRNIQYARRALISLSGALSFKENFVCRVH